MITAIKKLLSKKRYPLSRYKYSSMFKVEGNIVVVLYDKKKKRDIFVRNYEDVENLIPRKNQTGRIVAFYLTT